MKLMENCLEDWTTETYANAQKDIEKQKQEWEEAQLKHLQDLEKEKLEDEDDDDEDEETDCEDVVTYSSIDAANKVNKVPIKKHSEKVQPEKKESKKVVVTPRKPGRPPKANASPKTVAAPVPRKLVSRSRTAAQQAVKKSCAALLKKGTENKPPPPKKKPIPEKRRVGRPAKVKVVVREDSPEPKTPKVEMKEELTTPPRRVSYRKSNNSSYSLRTTIQAVKKYSPNISETRTQNVA